MINDATLGGKLDEFEQDPNSLFRFVYADKVITDFPGDSRAVYAVLGVVPKDDIIVVEYITNGRVRGIPLSAHRLDIAVGFIDREQ